MGESIVEGTITKWLKKPGDKVQRDEPLFEISTDKVDAEIPAPASGVLREIKVTEGTTVGVNTVVGTIVADGEAAAPPAKPAAPAAPAAEKPAVAKVDEKKAAPAPPPPATPVAHEEEEEARSSPLVRKIAREHGVFLPDLRHRTRRPHHQAGHPDIHREPGITSPSRGDGHIRPSRRSGLRPNGDHPCFSPCRTTCSSAVSRRPRSPNEHAQDHCPAHDRVSPNQRSRPLHVRSGLHPHRQPTEQAQSRIRAASRCPPHLHALLRARGRHSPSAVAHRQRFPRRRASVTTARSTWASRSLSTGA